MALSLGMTKLDRNLAADIPYLEAQSALNRRPHPPAEMMSLNSMGPIKAWCCSICAGHGWTAVEYTVTLTPPVCQGGREFF